VLRDEVAEVLRHEQLQDGYVYPTYESYCIGNVAATIRSLFDMSSRRPLPGNVFLEFGPMSIGS
jgi:hypothetical protein